MSAYDECIGSGTFVFYIAHLAVLIVLKTPTETRSLIPGNAFVIGTFITDSWCIKDRGN